jgi:hypothetical protein
LVFSFAKSENNCRKNIESISKWGKKKLAKVANGFVVLLANPEFYSHLVSGYPHPWCSHHKQIKIDCVYLLGNTSHVRESFITGK